MEALREDAEPIPGPSTKRLAEIAQKLNIALCVGMAEQGLAHKPFNTQVVVGPGGVIHRQRKMEPTLSERDFYRGGGDEVTPFALNDHTFGITICADNRFHSVHNHLYEQGARHFLAPHAGAIKKYEEPGEFENDLFFRSPGGIEGSLGDDVVRSLLVHDGERRQDVGIRQSGQAGGPHRHPQLATQERHRPAFRLAAAPVQLQSDHAPTA